MNPKRLNHSLRLEITDVSLPTPSCIPNGACPPVLNTYTFYNEYIYRFQGAGTASGGNGGGGTPTITASAIQATYGAEIPAITISGTSIPNQTTGSILIAGCSTPLTGFINNNIFTAPPIANIDVLTLQQIQSCANLGTSTATLSITGYSNIPVNLTMVPLGRANPTSMTYTTGDNFVQFASGGGIKITKSGSSTPLNTTSNTVAPYETVQITVTGLTDFQTGQPLNSGLCYIDLATTPSGQVSQALFNVDNTSNQITQSNIINGSCTLTGKIGYQQNYQLGQFKVRLNVMGPKGNLAGMGDMFTIAQAILI